MHSVIFNKSNNETHNTVQVSFSKVNITRVPAVYFISSTAATASVIATAQLHSLTTDPTSARLPELLA